MALKAMSIIQVEEEEECIKMTKQEILDKLEEIKDTMDTDFLNRYAIEGITQDITELQWKINTKLTIGIE